MKGDGQGSGAGSTSLTLRDRAGNQVYYNPDKDVECPSEWFVPTLGIVKARTSATWEPEGYYAQYGNGNDRWAPNSPRDAYGQLLNLEKYVGDPWLGDYYKGNPLIGDKLSEVDCEALFNVSLGNATIGRGFWISKYPAVGVTMDGNRHFVSRDGYNTSQSMEGWNWYDAIAAGHDAVYDLGIPVQPVYTMIATQAHMMCTYGYARGIADPFSYKTSTDYGNLSTVTGGGQPILGVYDLIGCSNTITSSMRSGSGRIYFKKDLYSSIYMGDRRETVPLTGFTTRIILTFKDY